ncbi:MAG: 2-oxo acid dehydrogenase subunit E2 [Oleiphilaceae bacterium]|nr:2-oxo acid dehydrogenase subunit E2 [Oleiphilaceae bacterium]
MTDLNANSQARDIIAPLEQEGTQAVVGNWLKKPGDFVSKDEPVVELETDKVVVEVSAPADGILQVVLEEGAQAEPGAVLGRVARESAGGAEPPKEMESGFAQKPEKPEQPTAPEPVTGTASASGREMRLSPAVRRLVAEHDLEPAEIEGTGKDGRLTRADVVQALSAMEQEPERAATGARAASEAPEAKQAAAPSPTPASLPESGGGPEVSAQVPHSRMRRSIAEHMQRSVTEAPHVTAVFEADFSAIIAHRKKHKAEFADQGVNLTFTAYFVAAAVRAMSAAPEVNSRWHEDYLELFKDINIGVGAALGQKGLIVPVIHKAQDLSLLGIANRLQALTEAARSNALKGRDVQGGTFTISNHGVSGSLFASPIIINQPQSAILGIGALEKRVVVREVDGIDSFQARPMAYVSLTIDHRVLDGSQTNAWLSRFVEVLQTWPPEG